MRRRVVRAGDYQTERRLTLPRDWDDEESDTCMPEFPDSDAILAQFNLLIEELLRGGTQRSRFQPSEVDLILDIESCVLRGSARRAALCEYQRTVQAELGKGAHVPLRFSEYLERREASRAQRKPAKSVSRAPVKP